MGPLPRIHGMVLMLLLLHEKEPEENKSRSQRPEKRRENAVTRLSFPPRMLV